MPLSETELSMAVDVALRAAHTAASTINYAMNEHGSSSSSLDVQAKGNPVDLVTRYDKQCEAEVLAILRSSTPLYAILSEETHGDVELGDEPTWVVDPIDGTTSFVHGLYDCCVSIALVVDKEPVVGVVSAPRLQEVYTAAKGRGAFCNGQRIHVSSTSVLQEAVVLVHQAYNRSEEAVASVVEMQKELAKIPVRSLRNNGAAALDMCFIATGRADLYLEVGIHAWDYAAGTLIVREAGGVVHDVEDTETFSLTRRGMCCGSCKALTAQGVQLAKKYKYRDCILNRN